MAKNEEKQWVKYDHKTEQKKQQTTRKMTKVLGWQEYINARTGQIEDFQVISVEERDANFHKIWLNHIIASLELVGNKKMKFALWLLEQMSSDNIIPMTFRQMAEKSKFSIDTVKRVIPALVESNFLVRINQGCYQVNPEIIFKGGTNKRMNVLIQYTNARKEESPPLNEDKENEE